MKDNDHDSIVKAIARLRIMGKPEVINSLLEHAIISQMDIEESKTINQKGLFKKGKNKKKVKKVA